MATLNELLPLIQIGVGILVTGPQRSGTTIAARILAHEFGYCYVDENSIYTHLPQFAKMFLDSGTFVVQAPALCYVADTLGATVVIMRRNIDDIHKSEERIGWRSWENGENVRVEKAKYVSRFGLSVASDNIARMKYVCWDVYQRSNCVCFDLDYDSLCVHPLWKEQGERASFGAKQWN